MAGNTALVTITDALIELGILAVDASPSSAVQTYGLRKLNNLIANLAENNLFVPNETSEELALGASAASYTIGSGATLNTDWPMELMSAQYKTSGAIYYPLRIYHDVNEYAKRPYKNQSSIPTAIYYNKAYPSGTIFFDYKPAATGTLALRSWKPLTAFATTAATWDGRPGYERALTLLLAKELANGQRVSSETYARVMSLAQEALESIETLNAANNVPVMEVDPNLPSDVTGRAYNTIYDG